MPRVRCSCAELVIEILAHVDLSLLSAQCRHWCRQLGASTAVEWAVAIAAREAAANMLEHAGGGRLTLAAQTIRQERCIRLEAVDQGTGIVSLHDAMRDRYSRGLDLSTAELKRPPPSCGTGLGAIARLMDELDIQSYRDGTRLIAIKRL